MFADRRRLVAVGVVAILVALGLWYQMSPAPAAAPVVSEARPRDGRAAASPAGVRSLKLEALASTREGPNETSQRNPFRFQPRVVAPPPRPVAPVVDTTPRPVAAPVPTGPPPPPPIALKFIAVLERASGVKWAVLSDGKSPPMYGREGDAIDGRYRIVKVGTESVEVTYLDGRGRQVIRLTGQ